MTCHYCGRFFKTRRGLVAHWTDGGGECRSIREKVLRGIQGKDRLNRMARKRQEPKPQGRVLTSDGWVRR